MSSPYRDYSIEPSSSGRRWRIPAGLAIGAVGLLVGLALARLRTDYRELTAAAAAIESLELNGVEDRLRPLRDHRLFGAAARQATTLAAIAAGASMADDEALAGTSEPVRFQPLRLEQLAMTLVERGQFPAAELVCRHGLAIADQPGLSLALGLARNGQDQVSEARRLLAGGSLRGVFEQARRGGQILVGGILREERARQLYLAHVEGLVRKEQQGHREYLLSHDGRALARVDLGSGRTELTNPAIASVAGAGTGLDRALSARDRQNQVVTTIDLDEQVLAHRLLAGKRGAVAVLDIEGNVTAAVGRDDRASGTAVDPFATLVELASVAKIITMVAAQSSPGEVADLFPYVCDRPLVLEGRPYYDWNGHGRLDGPEDALAVSCNLVFAAIGLRLGAERLGAVQGLFGFERPVPGSPGIEILAAATPPEAGERGLADFAVGLGDTRATVIGAAGIALAIATGGEYRTPVVIRRKLAIGGWPYDEASPARWRVGDGAGMESVRRGMVAAVQSELGTGRHAKPEGVSLALKTGTAGDRTRGFDALIVGFFPADVPRRAFAVYLPGSGRAQGPAAEFVRRLVEGLTALDRARVAPRLGDL